MNDNNMERQAEEPGLATQLRDRTADAHRAAERSPFMAALLKGEIGRKEYALLLGCLSPVYAALERAMREHRDHPALRPIYFPELERHSAVLEDLAHFETTAGATISDLPEAARAYAARLDTLAERQPELLVAHAYTRYMGDLSGGQILARQLRKAWAQSGDEGLSFFQFPQISDVTHFKNRYRENLDTLPVDRTQASAIVDEARGAFDSNRALADGVWEMLGAQGVA